MGCIAKVVPVVPVFLLVCVCGDAAAGGCGYVNSGAGHCVSWRHKPNSKLDSVDGLRGSLRRWTERSECCDASSATDPGRCVCAVVFGVWADFALSVSRS